MAGEGGSCGTLRFGGLGVSKDLIVVAADKDAKVGLEALLTRHQDLGTRDFAFDVFRYHQHDPGVFLRAQEFLRGFQSTHSHALVIFDREGCGQEGASPAELRDLVQERLDRSGWHDRSGVVVLDPELEVWVWAARPRVARILGTTGPELRRWLTDVPTNPLGKPERPKEALRELLRVNRVQVSSALFGELAAVIDFDRCQDPGFLDLVTMLRRWFPPDGGEGGEGA